MATTNNIFGSDGGPALPDGNAAKSLIIALLALFASRYFGGKGADKTASADPAPVPRIPQAEPASDVSPGNILGGLRGRLKPRLAAIGIMTSQQRGN